MQIFNYANDAAKLSDGELSAVIATYQKERERRAAIPPDKRPSSRAEHIARERHERLYGHDGSLATF